MPGLTLARVADAAAFTLIELLVVMGIIVLLFSMITPAFNAISGANDINRAIGSLAQAFEGAHTFAVSNNTYVYVGVVEVDASRSADASTQQPGIGRVVVMTVASKNGLAGFDVSNPQSTWSTGYGNGSNLAALGKPATFEKLHLADLGVPATGKMARATPEARYRLGNAACKSLTPFSYPLGSSLSSGYKYYFDKVIEFDPQGTARIVVAPADADSNPLQIEAGLQPTHGTATPPAPTDPNLGKQAAIQVDGITSSVRIYRP